MRLLLKLLRKFLMMVFMVFFMGAVMRYGQRYAFKTAGTPEGPKFSSEETDLMSTVFKSGVKLFTGQASRKELAGELSDKLYAGRDPQTMKELGIEMVSPGDPAGGSPDGKPGVANLLPGKSAGQPAAKPAPNGQAPNPGAASATPTPAEKLNAPGNPLDALNPLSAGKPMADAVNTALLDRLWKQIKANAIEFCLVPVVFLGMILIQRIRDRRSGGNEFMLPLVGLQTPAESEHYDMKHPVQSLGTEEFELLVALIYQRQGYRVSMPAGLSGGRGGDFTLLRKAERILVQCKKTDQDHRVPVERVRELRETMNILGLPRGMFVASCGFTWDARNYGKANAITLINARTLDELIIAAREAPDEDLLSVSNWVGKLMSKVQLTPPQCPACEAAMELVNASAGPAWLCTQRPDCRGRRLARKYQKSSPAGVPKADPTDAAAAPTDASNQGGGSKTAPKRSEAIKAREAKKPAAPAEPADESIPNQATQPAASTPRSSAIKLADNITHDDPARQDELHRMAQMARQAIAARRVARAREEARAEAVAAAPASQARQTTPAAPAAPASAGRPAVLASPGNRPAQTPPASRAVPATPGNQPPQAPPARQTVPATPGNRPPSAAPVAKVVPATPGNRPNS